jgi:transcriptional regulator with XRE-family HTH domain
LIALYYAIMPRIAKPPTIASIQARKALALYLAKAQITPNAFSQVTGVGQSTISRFLTGKIKSITPAIEPALRYANIDFENYITKQPDPLDNARIRDALSCSWDGSAESAELLAKLLEVIGPVVTRHVTSIARSSL